MADATRPVDERPVRLEVNGEPLPCWTASPDRLDALAVGRLLVDGFIASRADLLDLSVEETPATSVIRARVPPARAAAVRAGAGLQLDPLARLAGHLPADRPRAPLPPLDAFGRLFRELFQSAESYRETGGVHSAALSDGTRLRHQVEEVGRHNAVDKVVGLAVLAGDDLARLGILLSARISGEMAIKAARAQLAWMASRSVPTTLAVAVAEMVGLPIVARAAGREPYVYAAPDETPGDPGAPGEAPAGVPPGFARRPPGEVRGEWEAAE